MISRFRFPRRVRIHGGECGAVARALHHEAQKESLMEHELSFLSQAESEKFFDSTLNERKQMSTKTSMKQIALVVVAALGFGMVTGVSANADTPTPFAVTVALSDLGDNTATMTATQIAGAANYVAVSATDDADPQLAGNYDYITVSGSTFVYSVPTTPASINAATSNSTTITKVIGERIENGDTFWIGTPTAGTITFKYVRRTFTAGVATDTTLQTLTITVGSADVDAVASKAFLNNGSTTGATSDYATPVYSKDSTGTIVANVELTMKNLLGTPYSTAGVFSAVISGPGLIGLDNVGTPADGAGVGITVANAKVVPITFTGAGKAYVTVTADGTAGVATLSILAGGAVWKSKTISFSGVRTAYKVVSTDPATVKSVIAVTGTQEWVIKGVDALGLDASNGTGTVYAVSADSTIATAVMSTATEVTVTGVKPGKTSFRLCNTADCAAATIVLGPVDVIIGASKASAASVSFDKTTYEPGAPFTLTITASDAGNPLADGTYASMATVTSNVVVYAANPYPLVLGADGPVSPEFVGGKATYTGFMPSTPGTISLSLKLGTTGVADAAVGAVIAAPVVTVASAAVNAATDAANAAADAAAEAIDAANAATDAANLAAEAADAATVAAEEARDAADAATAAVEELASQVAALFAALKAQLTTLANTVAKIAKKVKA